MTTKETNQRRALAALLASNSIADAAELAGLTERTLYNYLADPDFKAALTDRQDELIAGATASLAAAISDAVATLVEVVTDDTAPAATRVRAAGLVLDNARRILGLDAPTRAAGDLWLKSIDFSTLTTSQLEAIAGGADPWSVLVGQ